jgi:hypothetical protein
MGILEKGCGGIQSNKERAKFTGELRPILAVWFAPFLYRFIAA